MSRDHAERLSALQDALQEVMDEEMAAADDMVLPADIFGDDPTEAPREEPSLMDVEDARVQEDEAVV